jgi:hypothetical protein
MVEPVLQRLCEGRFHPGSCNLVGWIPECSRQEIPDVSSGQLAISAGGRLQPQQVGRTVTVKATRDDPELQAVRL